MLTSRVKKYVLTCEEEQAIKTVRRIIDELNDEEFFEVDPFSDYSVEEALELMNDLLDYDESAIG